MKKQPKFEVFPDARGDWCWHLRAGNGRVIAQGESHHSAHHARRAIAGVIRAAACAVLLDSAPVAKPMPKAPAGKPAVKKAR